MPEAKNKTRKSKAKSADSAEAAPPPSILVIDIGGTKVKMLASGETEPRKVPSGKTMTPSLLVDVVKEHAIGWKYEAISMGYPGLVGNQGPRSEPGNLGSGWVGFNFGAAFGLPVRIINDAAMQALGSYEGGRMLFLGLGTGLGSSLICDNIIVPLELGQLRFNGETIGDLIGRKGLKRLGKEAWRAIVNDVATSLTRAFMVDYLVLGGGNAKNVKALPPGSRRGHNMTAFRGGVRLWNLNDFPTLSSHGEADQGTNLPSEWRVV